MKAVRLALIVGLGLAVALLLPACNTPSAENSAAPVITAKGGAAPKTPAAGKQKTIVFVGYSSSNPFWLTLKEGAAAGAKEGGAKLVDLTYVKPDIQKQCEAIQSAILQKPDGLVIGAVDSRGLGEPFKQAHEAGIPIVTVDTRVADPEVKCHIATDNLKAARLAGEYIVKHTGGNGKLLILGGTPGSQTAEDRRKGVEDVCKQAGMEIIFRPANWDGAKANEITQNELSANPDLAAIFAACDPMIVTAKEAVKSADKLGKVLLVGFDAIDACLKAIKAGEIDATVRQDPFRMGHDGVLMMLDSLAGKQVPKDIPIEAVVVDKSNVGRYLK